MSGNANHGNTCYLNSIIQILAHTEILKKLLRDLRKTNQILMDDRNETVMPTLWRLLMGLWNGVYRPELSMNLVKSIQSCTTLFPLNLQGDSHELLMWLFDLMADESATSAEVFYLCYFLI
jgi:ubiquitin C-terminal hydrolase